MNALKNTWRQLVRRRLWPVALLLVAALVAVPVVLAKPATPAPAPAPAVAAAPAATPAQSYVKLASDDASATDRRRVLGKSKDPFEPAPLPKVKQRHHAAKADASAAATATATPTATSSAPASTGGGDTTSPAPVATATPAPKKTYPANSVEVRFGKVSGGTMKKGTLTRLETLPDASSPLVVFMGFAHGGKDAVFMLTGTVTAEGDGHCDPNPQSCETLLLRKGQTEFVTVTGTKADGEYELDVNDIHATKSASASAAAYVARATATATPTAAATATATPAP